MQLSSFSLAVSEDGRMAKKPNPAASGMKDGMAINNNTIMSTSTMEDDFVIYDDDELQEMEEDGALDKKNTTTQEEEEEEREVVVFDEEMIMENVTYNNDGRDENFDAKHPKRRRHCRVDFE